MKINTKANRTFNTTHEGAPARRINNTDALRRSVMACLLWEKNFYEDGESIADRIMQLVAVTPIEDVSVIAMEARDLMHLRHVPLLIVAAMAKIGGKIVGDTLAHVIQRPDELAEFLAIYWKEGKCPLSAQVKRGLALAFPKFNEYQLAKYNRDGAVKLRDVLFMCHAKPSTPEQEKVWKSLIDGTLSAPDTWEVALSGGKDKLSTWVRLLSEKKLGITRKVLELFMNNDIRYQIVTKSDIVVRDIDILSKSRCSIAITVTTLKDTLARRLEPNAPSPNNRVKALEELSENGIPIIVRIDPIIPFINDDEVTEIVDRLSFVNHITTSTFKPRFDSWRRFKKVFPIESGKLEKLYFKEGEKISNSWYLPKYIRYEILSKVREKTGEYGISFGSCRENYYSNPTCDGSHLIP